MAAAVIGGLLLSAGTAAGGWVLSVAGDAPEVSELKPINKGQNSVVYAGDGSRLGLIDSDEVRTPISIRKMPKTMRSATVAIEDERFYSHNGIDVEGGLRALVRNVEEGEVTEGASTITMQLMRNIYIANPERDLERKIAEAQMALDYEKDHGKQQILQSYLNTAPYGTNQGRTAIGVQAAARVYFSEEPEDLTLPQSALLAGLPQAPSDNNPIQNPRGAIERRNDVLDSMADIGQLTEARAAVAKKSGLQLDPAGNLFDHREPYFFDYVQNELIKEYGVNTVRRGGLRVYSTVEPAMQEAGLQAIDSTLYYPDDPSSALVAIDPQNGEVKAMVSSSSYSDNQYNLAAQGKRQPGSTFKTFTLATAVSEGIDPNKTFYESKPLDIVDPVWGQWNVSTYSNSYSGTMSLVDATLASDNTVFAQLALDLGPDKVAEMAKALGVTTKLDGYPAETLGGLTLGVSPLEMASAYSTLAAGGIHRDPVAIRKVVFPDGAVDNPNQANPKRVMTEPAAYEVTKVLNANITGGTGTGAYTGCSGQAGKTGTTDNYTDGWFVGYQPNLATATWVGYPESNTISMTSVHGTTVAGGTFPATIWNQFYTNAAVPCESFPVPDEAMVWGDFGGNYTVSKKKKSNYDADAETDQEPAGSGKKKNGGNGGAAGDVNDPDQYAPGVGQDPAGTGGGDNGGGGNPAPTPAPTPPSSGGGGGGGGSPPSSGGVAPG
ncbi:MAG: transglycosylase domain-containing protein [Thermoleophilia bacterium]|nr:transglycosylase domain-containing protein [Thermoleophilia bacterium]